MMRRQITPLALAAFLAIPLLVACDSNTTGPELVGPASNPVGVNFEVGVVTVSLGQIVQLSSFLVFDSDAEPSDFAEGDWSTADENIVSVFPDGAVLGLEIGVALVTLEYQGKRFSVIVEVV
jgi:hypothetical protein